MFAVAALAVVASFGANAETTRVLANPNPSVPFDEDLVEIGKLVAAGYKGKTAVITGAASGMGLCTSQTLAAAGATVFMCDIDSVNLMKAAEEISACKCCKKGKVYPVVCDVRVFADAEKAAALAFETTGRIDLLINYAGGNEARILKCFKKFYDMPAEVIDWGLDVNLVGAIYFSRACMPYMVKAKSGVIVCLGSVTGFEGAAAGTMYGVAKSGLYNFVVGAAQAGAPFGVRVFCVAPGPVMTRPGMAGMQTLLGFPSETQEVVDYILYLSRVRSITATTHIIDCGRLALPRQASNAGFLANPADDAAKKAKEAAQKK